MTWGCKQPDGCRWAGRANLPFCGQQEWWCDVCERSGEVAIKQLDINDRPCGRCGRNPAEGYTTFNDVWYCHGVELHGERMTCYEDVRTRATPYVRPADLLAPCPTCGFYRDTPNHEHGCSTWNDAMSDSPTPAGLSESADLGGNP